MKPFFAFYDRMREAEQGIQLVALPNLGAKHSLAAKRLRGAGRIKCFAPPPMRSFYGNN
jgi:hypothetical protein